MQPISNHERQEVSYFYWEMKECYSYTNFRLYPYLSEIESKVKFYNKYLHYFRQEYESVQLDKIEKWLDLVYRMTYYQNNKDRIKKEARKCRDNREIRKILLKKQNGRCAKCGTTKNLSIDHIMPVSKCGANTIDNLQILCRSCNSKKSYKVE